MLVYITYFEVNSCTLNVAIKVLFSSLEQTLRLETSIPLNPWVKVQNFKNPELTNIKSSNLLYAFKIVLTMSSLNGQLPKDKLKINQRNY